MQKRIDYLDGLRGVAIILVILYHAYDCYACVGYLEKLPYGDKYIHFPLFKYGFLGVQLFFLISGFVILMTLEKSKNYFVFGYRRWIRLFPAMLIAILLLYPTASFFYARPAGQPNLWSVVSAITFIEPDLIKDVFNKNFRVLETSFWTLFIEVKFYIIFGGLFFLFGRNRALIIFSLIFLCSIFPIHHKIIEYLMSIGIENAYKLNKVNYILNGNYGWFIAGCLAYMYYRREEKSGRWLFVVSLLISIWCLFIKYGELSTNPKYIGFYYEDFFIIGLFILGVFYLPLISDNIAKRFSHRILLFMGFISYPLYLIHENTMISMIVQLNKKFPMIPDFILPFITLVPIISLAYAITKWGEPTLRKQIDNLIGKNVFK